MYSTCLIFALHLSLDSKNRAVPTLTSVESVNILVKTATPYLQQLLA